MFGRAHCTRRDGTEHTLITSARLDDPELGQGCADKNVDRLLWTADLKVESRPVAIYAIPTLPQK